MPEEKKPDAPEPRQPTHEELAAAAMAELLGESKPQGGEGEGPPEWFRKVYENT